MSMKRSVRRRASASRRRAAILTLGALGLAVAGLILWLALGRAPQITVQTYPVEYEDYIRACAAENGLEPAYPAAVILAESSYRPEAVSSANAQGLMQLLPDTGEWVAGKLGETYEEGCLFDPQTNIRYGCWFLGWLMRRYNGDMTLASSAYHQGHGTVDKWLATPEYSPDGATLAVIPSDATDTYVKRVLKYYEKYTELYAA